MSTAVETRALPRGATDWIRLKHVLLSMVVGLRAMLVGYWVVMVLGLFLGGLLIQLLTSGVTNSAWDYGTQSPKYFSMAIGITLTPAFLSLLVSQGVTRRMFSVAAGIYLAGAAAATSLVWVLMYQFERGLYSWQGWTQRLENPHLFTEPSQAGLAFAEFFLLVLSHEVTGWLLGISFLRLGVWWGVVVLPLALLPAAAAEFLLVAQWLADVLDNVGYHRPPLTLAVPSVLVVCVLGLYAGYRVLAPLGLKPPKG